MIEMITAAILALFCDKAAAYDHRHLAPEPAPWAGDQNDLNPRFQPAANRIVCRLEDLDKVWS